MDITQTFTAYCQESDTELGQDKEMVFIRNGFVFFVEGRVVKVA